MGPQCGVGSTPAVAGPRGVVREFSTRPTRKTFQPAEESAPAEGSNAALPAAAATAHFVCSTVTLSVQVRAEERASEHCNFYTYSDSDVLNAVID